MTGWSYGGYMTMFTVTQTNRFRGAVAGAGIANWQSYYGQNLIDQWMIPFFGSSVYDDPAVYAKSSPIHYIKNVKTPTLVIAGERNPRQRGHVVGVVRKDHARPRCHRRLESGRFRQGEFAPSRRDPTNSGTR